jgi:hypothetical protein
MSDNYVDSAAVILNSDMLTWKHIQRQVETILEVVCSEQNKMLINVILYFPS